MEHLLVRTLRRGAGGRSKFSIGVADYTALESLNTLDGWDYRDKRSCRREDLGHACLISRQCGDLMIKNTFEYIWLDGKRCVASLRGKSVLKPLEAPPKLAGLPGQNFHKVPNPAPALA